MEIDGDRQTDRQAETEKDGQRGRNRGWKKLKRDGERQIET